MKKISSLLFLFIIISHCSFDNKTGIWTEKEKIFTKNKNEKLEDVFVKAKIFNEEIILDENIKLEIDKPLKTFNYLERYANPSNNISNIYYNNNNYQLSKSKKRIVKFPKKLTSNYSKTIDILLKDNNLISFDHKGTIFVYSLEQEKKILEYNFYKKKYKKFKKILYLSIEDNILYVSDNIGYAYSIDLNTNNLIWAKNFGVPFRSNIKTLNNQIFLANQDNIIYALSANNGETVWQFSTSPTTLKTNFLNNIAINEDTNELFFLNTSGELYAFDYFKQQIKWFLNVSKSTFIDDSDLFVATPIVVKSNNILISTEKSLKIFNTVLGEKKWEKKLSVVIKPTITKNNVFLITSNNILVCLDVNTGEIIWSKKLMKLVEDKNIKKINYLLIVNDKVLLFSSSGYLLTHDYKNGNLISINKILKSGLLNYPIISNGKMFILDKKYKLSIFD